MAIKTDKMIVYHIPKCGGIWVKEAIRRSLKDNSSYGRAINSDKLNPFGLYREHSTPNGTVDDMKVGRLSVCFVRHPVAWIKSFWAFRIKSESYDPKFPLDDLMDKNLDKFVDNIYDKFPFGFVKLLYVQYTGNDLSKINFIGKQETLADDLIEAMNLAGEEFVENIIRSLKWINVASAGKKYRKMVSEMSSVSESKILEKEEWVVETFYKNNV